MAPLWQTRLDLAFGFDPEERVPDRIVPTNQTVPIDDLCEDRVLGTANGLSKPEGVHPFRIPTCRATGTLLAETLPLWEVMVHKSLVSQSLPPHECEAFANFFHSLLLFGMFRLAPVFRFGLVDLGGGRER